MDYKQIVDDMYKEELTLNDFYTNLGKEIFKRTTKQRVLDQIKNTNVPITDWINKAILRISTKTGVWVCFRLFKDNSGCFVDTNDTTRTFYTFNNYKELVDVIAIILSEE